MNKDFTIVQWDQRGAGRTYAKNPNSPPEPERVELDGIELAQYLCDYLAKKAWLLLAQYHLMFFITDYDQNAEFCVSFRHIPQ